ncbi:MAG: DegT/DnrJ/EryC1/StrS family aminotransferase [Phycisphaerales bacterium]|nr:DegT/DnrJ/EryC1/StrS family aminotransferase [Phycisphaerales bacterium]
MSEHEIPLSRPDLSSVEEELVVRVLRSGRLSLGPMQEEFEQAVTKRAGRRHGVAVSNGTCGLHLALLALGVGPGDEVITTPFSFIASSNVILHVGATPVFVDICPRTLNLDPTRLDAAITPRTKAMLAVECFGNPAYMEQYEAFAARHEIPLIEDCCEALGCSLRQRPCGGFGRVGVFGFYPNKQATTGEGGVIVTDDDALADHCRALRNQGRAPGAASAGGASTGSWLSHPYLGYNYRLSELQAAVGAAQMRRFDEIVQRRQHVARLYVERLRGHPEIIVPTVDEETTQSWFLFVVRLSTRFGAEERDRIIRGMRTHDIGCAPYFPCIHLQPPYRRLGKGPGSFPIAESVSGRTIALPFFGRLSGREVDLVAQTLELMIQRESFSRRDG